MRVPSYLRAASHTRQSLAEAGVTQQRLVVNRFSTARFRAQGCYRDLDSVIDAAGIRLIAVIPEDPLLAASTLGAKAAPDKSPGMMAVGRLAARMEGERVPLPAVNRF